MRLADLVPTSRWYMTGLPPTNPLWLYMMSKHPLGLCLRWFYVSCRQPWWLGWKCRWYYERRNGSKLRFVWWRKTWSDSRQSRQRRAWNMCQANQCAQRTALPTVVICHVLLVIIMWGEHTQMLNFATENRIGNFDIYAIEYLVFVFNVVH